MTDKQITEELTSKDLKEIKNEVLKAQKELSKKSLKKKSCIVCGKDAEYCMRGLPDNTYCKPCAKDYFKLLSYLDRL